MRITALFLLCFCSACSTTPEPKNGPTSTAIGGDVEPETLRAQCDEGEAESCYELGARLEEGSGVEKDPSAALGLFARGCELGDMPSCHAQALLLVDDYGVPKDWPKARALFEKACGSEIGESCTMLGFAWEQGWEGLEADPAKAAGFFESACGLEDAFGCIQLGLLYRHGKGVPNDLDQTRALFEKACGLEQPTGCSLMGIMYEQGYLGQKDPQKANEYFKRTVEMAEAQCRQGVSDSCYVAGDFVRLGKGVEPDKARAVELLRRACDYGDERACEPMKAICAETPQPGCP